MASKKFKPEVHALLDIDDSGSMRGKRNAAADMIEKQLAEIGAMNAKTFSLILFGQTVETKLSFVNPQQASTPAYNPWQGSTKVIDSIWTAIDHLETAPKNANTVYLIMVVTDGEDNASRRTARELKNRIDKLVKTDKWTFVFNGVGPEAERFAKSVGIPEGNFQRFDDSDAGVRSLTQANVAGTKSLAAAYASGQTATRGFYKQVDMAGVKTADVKQDLADVTDLYEIVDVGVEMTIRNFVEQELGEVYDPKEHRGFYELTKPEKCVQDYKAVLLQDKRTGRLFTGPQAHTILGLDNKDEPIKPGDLGTWRVFILSTS